VRSRLIPVFNELTDWALKFVGKASETKEVHDKTVSDMDKYAKEHGTRLGGWGTAGLNVFTGVALAGNAMIHAIPGLPKLMGKGNMSEENDKIFKGYYQMKYGGDAYTYGMAGVPETVKNVVATREELAARSEARRKEHKKEQDALRGDVNREADTTKTAPYKFALDKELKSSDAMLRVGGLMTKDTTYNLTRLTEQTNKILTDILKAIKANNGDTEGDTDAMDFLAENT
jgi:hypothetical protein